MEAYKSYIGQASVVSKSLRYIHFFMWGVLLAAFVAAEVRSQTLPLGFPVIEDAARRQQLVGAFDSTFSFTLRPIYSKVFADTTGAFQIDSTSSARLWKELASFSNGKGSIRLLPAQLRVQYNNKRPYGWNNGAMIPAAGLQTLLSAGVFAKWGPLQIQLRPEVVYAGNKDFEVFEDAHDGAIKARRYTQILNRIDAPERFGEEAYKKILPGQSSVRLHFKGVSAGFSTESIWWGPGRHNSLVMTNNAGGFQHFTLNTSRPVKTPIGHIEFQLIGGKLDASGYYPADTGFVFNNRKIYRPKVDDWRYLNGLMASYQPKWVKGLAVGGARIVQQYSQGAKAHNDYLPILTHVFRGSKPGLDDSLRRDQILTLFARWAFEKAKAEIYAEYGRNDASWSLRDYLMSPQHSMAYVIGFTKLMPLKTTGSLLELNIEFTQLERSGAQLLRPDPEWYANHQIRHGYTHNGEVVGAGIGTGSNMQYVGLYWMKGLNRIGAFYERVVHDNDFMYEAFKATPNYRHYWVDVGVGVVGDYHTGNFLLSGRLQVVKALNYQWEVNALPGEPTIYQGRDLTNLFFSINTAYLF